MNSLTLDYVYALAVSGPNLFAGTSRGVYYSNNNGTNWGNTGLTSTDVRALTTFGTNLFAGSYAVGVFLSTNNGTSWSKIDTGLTSTDIRTLAISGTNLFAGIGGGGVWRRPLTEMITTRVNDNHNQTPTRFVLEQNYPNPFNPATTISFSVPSKSFVSLKVFDALGREVATIISEEMSAGNYSRQWIALNMPSGIYFYRLQAGSFAETKKLSLIR
jgi:hypothetical protein